MSATQSISNKLKLLVIKLIKSDTVKVILLTIGIVVGILGFLNGLNHSFKQPVIVSIFFGSVAVFSFVCSLILLFSNRK
jgi:hypothetical protein